MERLDRLCQRYVSSRSRSTLASKRIWRNVWPDRILQPPQTQKIIIPSSFDPLGSVVTFKRTTAWWRLRQLLGIERAVWTYPFACGITATTAIQAMVLALLVVVATVGSRPTITRTIIATTRSVATTIRVKQIAIVPMVRAFDIRVAIWVPLESIHRCQPPHWRAVLHSGHSATFLVASMNWYAEDAAVRQKSLPNRKMSRSRTKISPIFTV